MARVDPVGPLNQVLPVGTTWLRDWLLDSDSLYLLHYI